MGRIKWTGSGLLFFRDRFFFGIVEYPRHVQCLAMFNEKCVCKTIFTWINKSYTPWREGSDGRQIEYKNYICSLHKQTSITNWRSWEPVSFHITATSYCSLVVSVLCCKPQGPWFLGNTIVLCFTYVFNVV